MRMDAPVAPADAPAPLSRKEADALATMLAQRFIQRRDLFAVQREAGSYVCLHKRLRRRHLRQHLRGALTLGTYLLDRESRGRFLVFDADNAPDWRRLHALAHALDDRGAPAYLERSRRGGHLWLFFAAPLAGAAIRRFGQGLMLFFGLGGLELFPKQEWLGGGPGSLIRLPFGIHRKAGRRYGFYTLDGQPLAPTLRGQVRLLAAAETVPSAVVDDFSACAPAKPQQERAPVETKPPEQRDGQQPLYAQVKAALPVLDFVGRYVDLSRSGTGLCPFHDDQVASFSVNAAENYWYCFACGIGGSIIDFWCHYRDCDFGTAVDELAEILL